MWAVIACSSNMHRANRQASLHHSAVAPRNFRGTELFIAPEFWAPVVNVPEVAGYDPLDSRNNHYAGISGHLEPGVLF
jgi:hypothetical protein